MLFKSIVIAGRAEPHQTSGSTELRLKGLLRSHKGLLAYNVICTYVCTYICTHVCKHACMQTYIYECMCSTMKVSQNEFFDMPL